VAISKRRADRAPPLIADVRPRRSMRRKRRSDEVLRAASDHLCYEYWMFRELTAGLATGTIQPGWLHNALVESWVVHLRAIVDFVFPPKSVNPDDVVAADFFDRPSDWEAALPAMSEALTRGRRRAAKEIVHLSYRRIGINHEDKQWHFVALAAEVEPLMAHFLRQVPKNRLGPRWSSFRGGVA